MQVGYNTKELSEIEERNELVEETRKLSEIFFEEGYPENWNSTNVAIIGIKTDNRMDWNKLESLKEMGYQKSLVLLGLNLDYNMTIFNKTDSVWGFGKSPENASSVVKINRIGILNSSIVYIQILVFK